MNPSPAFSRRVILGAGAALAIGACGGDEAPTPPPSGGTGPTPSPGPTGSVVPAGNRVLGISPTEREADDFNPVVDLLLAAGCSNATLSLYWDEIETAPGVYDPQPNFAQIANQYYPSRNVSLSVSIVGIDTNVDRRPADLAALPYDHPEVIARYRGVIDWVLDQMRDTRITNFAIGNEVDGLLAADPDLWPAYTAAFGELAQFVRDKRPGLTVGSKVTFGAVFDADTRALYLPLLDLSDAAMVTYYPLADDFMARELGDVARDFALLAALPAGKPVHLLECGYPSAAALGSSEAQQAEFVSACFAGWDEHRDRIAQIDFFALHDFSPAIVDELRQYYGISQNGAAFLGSLGLRKWPGEGRDKQGWTRFGLESASRGFGT
ncbi:MAG: hypothetical protein ACX930_09930 [Erythrobacter sp.]